MKSSRKFVLLLVLGVFVSLVGCGKSDEEKSKAAQTQEQQQQHKEKKGD